MVFEHNQKRLTPADWTAWSAPIDPVPIGPSVVSVRHDRLAEYLNPSAAIAAAAKESEKQATNQRLTDMMHDLRDAESGNNAVHASSQRHSSVAAIMKGKEAKTVKQKAEKGPPNEVKQNFGLTRLSPFVLIPSALDLHSKVELKLGENILHHDPLESDLDATYSIVHAYLKRVLISTIVPDSVVLIKHPEEGDGRDAPPRGFQPVGDG
jgi:hypothetical protein